MASDQIRFHCPECDRAVTVDRRAAGKHGKCPACGARVQVPTPKPQPAAAPAVPAPPAAPASDPGDYATLLGQSMVELRLKTAAHDGTWHLGQADWDVDQEVGQIVFTTPGGITATCPVQIVGTYNTTDGTWLWGWDHPSVEPPLQEHARRVREYGERHHIDKLTTQKVRCSEDEAWAFTALACKLGDAQGGYRGPMGPTLVFMTFGTVSLSQAKRK
jgi:hypothetical protein